MAKTKVELTDKCGLEHMGQMLRINAKEPKNTKLTNVNWKKVDWKKTEEDMKEKRIENDRGWIVLKNIIKGMPKVKNGKSNSRWGI